MTSLSGSRRFIRIATLAAIAVSVVACGGQSQAPAQATSPGVLTGTASSLNPVTAIAVRDSSAPPLGRNAALASSGTFSVNVNGLKPPFIVKATDAKGGTMFALSPGTGPVSVNVLTTAAVEESSNGGDAEHDWEGSDHDEKVAHVDDLLKQLQTVLAPLLDRYGIKDTHDIDESAGFQAMLQEVSFTIDAGVLTIANKATGGIIFTAPLDALATGVLHPENIPGGTPAQGATCMEFTYSAWGACQADGTQTRTVTSATPQACTGGNPVLSQSCTTNPAPADGATLYAQACASCHGPLASSDLKGRNMSVTLIQSKNMSKGLDATQLQAIVTAVGP